MNVPVLPALYVRPAALRRAGLSTETAVEVATMSRETALAAVQPSPGVCASAFRLRGAAEIMVGFPTVDGYFVAAGLEGSLRTAETWFSPRRKAFPLAAGTLLTTVGLVVAVDWRE